MWTPLGLVVWDSLCFLYLKSAFFSRLSTFSGIISFSNSLPLSPSLVSFWMPTLAHRMLFEESLRLASLFKIPFSPFCSAWVISITLSSGSLVHSLSSNLLLILSSILFVSVIVFFSLAWFSFIFSYSLLKLSLCSSILPSSVSIIFFVQYILEPILHSVVYIFHFFTPMLPSPPTGNH